MPAPTPPAPPEREPIAIVGLTALHPGSSDAEGFWRDILEGRDLMTDIPANYWLIEDFYDPDPKTVDKTYAKRGAFLSPVDFDAMEFGLPPSALASTDTGQLLGLIGAKRVLADAAAGRARHVPGERVSVILGGAGTSSLAMHISGRLQRPAWVKGLREIGLPESTVQAACDKIAECYTPFQENTFPGMLGNVIAGRIANRFNLGGSNYMVDAACAGSLAAISAAINELHLHQADMVITGGVDAMNDILMFMCFSKTPALSASGDCRPFSDNADGTMLGEGLTMFALRRLSDAERDGDKIYAVIRGLGSSSDGRAKSVYAPRPEGQAMALRRAYAASGFGPETVELVEAHGTGTFAGDAAEFAGLRAVFEESGRTDRQWCALGSVKSQIGHTKGAAGAAGLFKAVMALHHKVLPPTIKVDQPNPKLSIAESPFYLNTQARPWLRDAAHPRRAGVSSFGFGGTNFHVVLEEYIPQTDRTVDRNSSAGVPRLSRSPVELLVIAEATTQEVVHQCRTVAGRLAAGADWRHLAAELQDRFDSKRSARLAVIAGNPEEARLRLEEAAQRLSATVEKRIREPGKFYFQTGSVAGAITFLFPGQGSQYVGMGGDLAMTFSATREGWDYAETVLEKHGQGIFNTVFPKPAFNAADRAKQVEQLTRTECAQPALAVAGLAHLAILNTLGVRPDFTAGHSFGELLALHAAGVMNRDDLLRAAQARGALMAACATRPGAMTAVSCSVTELQTLLAEWNLDVVLANHNSPSQAVLSGSVEAIAEAEQRLAAAAISFQRLRVSAAFHSPLVAEAATTFSDFLQDVSFHAPRLPVFSNTEAAPYPTEANAAKRLLAQQLARPVRFAEQIEALYEAGARIFIQLGAGSTLSNLTSQCLAGRDHLALTLDQKGMHGVTALWHALGQLSAAGVPVRFAELRPAFAPTSESQPTRASASTFRIDGAGYGRPYPPRGGASARPAPNPEKPAPLHSPARTTVATPTPLSAFPSPAPLVSENLPSSVPSMATPPSPVPSEPSSPAVPTAAAGSLSLDAIRELQTHISESQKAAQTAIVESLSLTLNALESLVREVAPGHIQPARMPVVSLPSPAVPSLASNHSATFPDSMQSESQVLPLPSAAPKSVPQSASTNGVSLRAEPDPLIPEATPAPGPAQGPDLQSLLLEIVAEKTGYPADVLNLDMELESGLGIDSIKRVEIFSAMQERAAGLPEVTTEHMASLRTLREILSFLGATQSSAANNTTQPVKTATAPASTQASAKGPDLQALLLEVVAEKTGYPADVLNLDMELESGLGIDSIKRVEIFSAMQERAAGLPDVTTEHMASLRTLREILSFLGATQPPAANNVTTSLKGAAAPEVTPALVQGPDLQKLLLEVVAEKTGYPADVLNLDMELESGLGIDSIKRVEIFSAMQERAVGLPEVTTEHMASLRTLREIISFLGGHSAAAANVAEPMHQPSKPAINMAAMELPPCQSVQELDRPAPVLPMPGLFTCSSIAVTDEGTGIAAALVARLQACGVPASLVKEVPAGCPGVIFLGALRPCPDLASSIAIHEEAFRAAQTAAQQSGGPELFVAVQALGGDFGMAGSSEYAAWSAGVAGIVKTAAQEWPTASYKVIDLERGQRGPDELAQAIADELCNGADQLEVGLRANGRRTTLITVPQDLENKPLSAGGVNERCVIVASGGGRGVTAACLVELARVARPRIALLGRTVLEPEPASYAQADTEVELKRVLTEEAKAARQPLDLASISRQADRILAMREIRATLDALAQAGSPAIYVAANVQDAGEVGQALHAIRAQWGPITGVVHGAGILADRKIVDKTPEQFKRVFDTKVLGLHALLKATANDPLKIICLFSSVAARYGNSGQCDYAAANEVLNKVAAAEARRRGASCRVKSLNWGPWAGGMVTPTLAAHFRNRGIPLISMEGGSHVFVRELCHTTDRTVEIVIGSEIEGSLAASAAPGFSTEILVNSRTYPIFNGHRVKSDPVVPAVIVMEWFYRAAAACRPGFQIAACRDFQVLKGIVLPRFEQEGHVLRVLCQEGSSAATSGEPRTLRCELRSGENQLHYSAIIELCSPEKSLPPAVRTPVLNLKANHAAAVSKDFYAGALFHGPEFRVLHSLENIDEEGAQGKLLGHRQMNWQPGPWKTEAAGYDGALQLVLLWGRQHLGGPSLPTRIGRCVQYEHEPAEGLIHSVVRCRKVGRLQSVSDIHLRHLDGRPIADLFDVEMHLVSESAFSAAAQ